MFPQASQSVCELNQSKNQRKKTYPLESGQSPPTALQAQAKVVESLS
jgi:hypothetical protein